MDHLQPIADTTTRPAWGWRGTAPHDRPSPKPLHTLRSRHTTLRGDLLYDGRDTGTPTGPP